MAESNVVKNPYNLLAGKKFKALRLELKMTQGEMAEMLSFETGSPVDIKSISCWENGERKLPSWVTEKAEIMRLEYRALNIVETKKGTVIKNKARLLVAMSKRVKALLKGD